MVDVHNGYLQKVNRKYIGEAPANELPMLNLVIL